MAQRKGKGSRGSGSKGDRKAIVDRILRDLGKLYPEPALELEYENAFELLIEAILASQESDKKVNSLRASLFSKYKSPEDFLNTPLEEIERDISSVNFYRRKAKLIKSCCQKLVEEFGGEVPKTVEELTRLPGVGRKTANMVIGGAFGLPAMIVDRHVLRVSQRLGLTDKKDADKAEMELSEQVPKENWRRFSLLLMNHGKNVCTARNPKCEECPLCDLCPSCAVKI